MTKDELIELLNEVQAARCETATLEIKAAELGCPQKLYDTLSGFSNQDDGGVILFGVDEKRDFLECGVYDSQDLQKKINEQCRQMEPVVRPLLTVVEKGEQFFVSAEIPGMDLADRPCYYRGKGRLKGSYVRVGDSDEPMTEYEVYRFESFRRKYQDDVRPVERASRSILDQDLLTSYIDRLRESKPNLAALPDETISELMSITREGAVTMSSVLLFCRYPQAFFPQLVINAVAVPGDEMGSTGESGERFLDNQRIEGTIPEMLDAAIAFVRRNMKTRTIVDPDTGKRMDRTEYPIVAIREAVLNALIHRDYSIHTEGMPIQIRIHPRRMEIISPGGIFGRLRVEQLGKLQPDTRNPVLATAMEVLGLAENRYSGIPTIRREMKEAGLRPPRFRDDRGTFIVTLYNEPPVSARLGEEGLSAKEEDLLTYLKTPRSRREIAEHLQIGTINYAMQAYIVPLIERGLVRMTIPEQPRSQKQRYVRTD